MPWKPGKHHWVPQSSNWAKEHPKLYKETYKKFTTYLPGEGEHEQVQRDEREVGPIGSIARYDLRRWNDEFEKQYSDDEFDNEY